MRLLKRYKQYLDGLGRSIPTENITTPLVRPAEGVPSYFEWLENVVSGSLVEAEVRDGVCHILQRSPHVRLIVRDFDQDQDMDRDYTEEVWMGWYGE